MKSALSNLAITLFLCGDVMTGRGIDQVLPHPGSPRIYEPYVRDARGYVELAERVNGPIPAPVDFDWIWGDALRELKRVAPQARIINLETAVTSHPEPWPAKGINYRMHPANIPSITSAGIDVAVLANNHVIDWGYPGLEETLATLDEAQVKRAGAGRNLEEAQAPAIVEVAGKGRVLVFSFGTESSGVPPAWAAARERAGVRLLKDLSERTVLEIGKAVRAVKRPGDIVVASIHWGGNWGYDIPRQQREFAQGLIDSAGVDIVHGHSSHHVKGIEVYRGRPILYGCGDFITDYEGISGNESYRDDLGLMYFVSMDPSGGGLTALRMTPTRLRNFRVNRASPQESRWLMEVLNREGRILGTRVDLGQDGTLELRWE